jgi:hypothetical protein
VTVPAHDQKQSHAYLVHFPAHAPRTGDPNYVDFDAFHRKNGPDARCLFALRYDLPDTSVSRQTAVPHRLIGSGEARANCDVIHPMELHHAHIEFSLQNGVDLSLLEKDYPGVSDPKQVGAWVETGENFVWLCVFHHRGHGGAHTASASDYEAERYVRGLIT